eukprot:CAMPEP_0179191986 /NCGR_PEP_ID=MMETSP0796-20121207/95366_1 /TAXON_ID=73915 /ORGANISM="Pyrodinium bahamense, Strain pbaha01" /LENGTH=64 /DNA_ID=CAMNT_0020896221 /DNA_START=92 /DNA_END=283 /DNA_ORIENTATION=-
MMHAKITRTNKRVRKRQKKARAFRPPKQQRKSSKLSMLELRTYNSQAPWIWLGNPSSHVDISRY